MTMNDVEKINRTISKAISGFKPPENLTVSQWADKNRRLSPESSAETGLWRTSRTPYLKEIMDSFNDPKVRHIVMVSSSQVGKSEAMNNIVGYIIAQDPGSILFVQPTMADAKEYSKLRIAPMIRDCKTLRNKVTETKRRDSREHEAAEIISGRSSCSDRLKRSARPLLDAYSLSFRR